MHDRNKNRPGYKKTKAGWIPIDWKCVSLEDVAYVQTGLAINQKNNLQNPVGCPYLRVANVQDNYLDLREIKTIEVESHKVERYRLKYGDVLFTEGGDFDKLGRGTIWRNEIEDCLHQNHIFAVRCKSEYLNRNFLAALSSCQFGRRYFILSSKQSTNLASINSTQLKAFPLPLPKLNEQKKITKILSDWDATIYQTRKLIAAKKNRKKALMQQLLDNNSTSHWKVEPFSKLFKRIQRVTTDNIDDILSVTANLGFVHQNEKFSRVIAGKNLSRYILLKKGEFAYNKWNSKSYPQGCIYMLQEYEQGAVPNVYFCFKPRTDKILGRFYRYYFEAGLLNHQLYRVINTGVRNDGLLNLNPKDFFNLSIKVPPVNEQRHISDVFAIIDSEIIALKNELAVLQKQKRGLMQKLLTGEVRIKV